jgi:hypothetical protein
MRQIALKRHPYRDLLKTGVCTTGFQAAWVLPRDLQNSHNLITSLGEATISQ